MSDKSIAIAPISVDLPEEAKILYSSEDAVRMAGINLLAAAIAQDGFIVASEYLGYINHASHLFGKAAVSETSLRVALLQKLSSPPDLIAAIDGFVDMLSSRYVTSSLANDILLTVVQSLEHPDEHKLSRIDKAIRALPGGASAELRDARSRLGRSSKTMWAPLFGYRRSQGDQTAIDSPTSPLGLVTETNKRAFSGEELVSAVRQIAETIGDSSLKESADEFQRLLKVDEFRIALVGEMKRGKSSLLNALAGEMISPIGETMATTAAVVELAYANAPSYSGQWICEGDINFIRERIQSRKSNVFVQEYSDHFESLLEHPDFTPGAKIDGIFSLDDLPRYLSATTSGSMAAVVGKVTVRLPLPMLRGGAIVVDTPGINDPIQVRDEMTLRHAQTCRCIVMVMSAIQLGTDSEASFLRRLAESGVALRLVIAITHIDLVTDRQPAELKTYLSTWLEKILRDLPTGKKLSSCARVCVLDAAKAVQRVRRGDKPDAQMSEFLAAIQEQINALEQEDEKHEKMLGLRRRLQEKTQNAIVGYSQSLDQVIPDESACAAIRRQADSFTTLVDEFLNMLRERLKTVNRRLELQSEGFAKDLVKAKAAIATEVELAYRREIQSLGDLYAKRDWKEFYNSVVTEIVAKEFAGLSERYRQQFDLWNLELEGFCKEMDQLLPASVERLTQARSELGDVCPGMRRYTAIMCDVDRLGKRLSNIGGWGLSTVAVVAIGTASLFPLLPQIGAVALLSFVSGKMLGVLSKPEERKEKFIRSHTEDTMKRIDEYLGNVENKFNADLNSIGSRFTTLARMRYEPLLKESMLAAMEAKLNAKVFERVRNDTVSYLQKMSDAAYSPSKADRF